MTIQTGKATAGEKEIKRDYPLEEGLIAGTTKQEGTKAHLEPLDKSLIPDRKKGGL